MITESFDQIFQVLKTGRTMEEIFHKEDWPYVRVIANEVCRDNDSLEFLESLCKNVFERDTDIILSTEKHCYAVPAEHRTNCMGEELPKETFFLFHKTRMIY